MVYASPSTLARGSAEGPSFLMIVRICCLNSLSCATLESSVEATKTRPARLALACWRYWSEAPRESLPSRRAICVV
jgi:hypothetical protein